MAPPSVYASGMDGEQRKKKNGGENELKTHASCVPSLAYESGREKGHETKAAEKSRKKTYVLMFSTTRRMRMCEQCKSRKKVPKNEQEKMQPQNKGSPRGKINLKCMRK